MITPQSDIPLQTVLKAHSKLKIIRSKLHIYALSLTFFSIHDSQQFEDNKVHVTECSSVAVLDMVYCGVVTVHHN